MAGKTPRHALIPNANNVRFLTRVLGFIARGVRDPKALAEVLDCELQAVHYYTQAGDWLVVFFESNDSRSPSGRLGLEYVYAEGAAGLCRSHLVNPLCHGPHERTGCSARCESHCGNPIESCVPEMAPTTARRRTRLFADLIRPALKHRKHSLKTAQQMSFQFAPSYQAGVPPPVVDLRAGTEESPDVYRVILRSLLDHGG